MFQQQFLPICGFPLHPIFPIKDGIDVINYSSYGIPGPPGPQGPAGPTGPTGPTGPAGPAGSLIIPTITVEADYTALTTDYFIGVTTSAAYTITLPVSVDGTVYIVKDISGQASTNPITIVGTASTIDGALSAAIDVDFGSITLVFNEDSWSLV